MRGFQIWLRNMHEESLVGMRCWLGGNIRLGSKMPTAQLQAVYATATERSRRFREL